MLKLALCVSYGASVRTESRGAHFREDFPQADDARWFGHLRVRQTAAGREWSFARG
jgi:succinate dehydrogenase/fumarate reductase flavoprotein subunit